MRLVNSAGVEFQSSLYRNGVDNECMDIWQRGEDRICTDTMYGPDRWCILIPDGKHVRVRKQSVPWNSLWISSDEPIDIAIMQIMDTNDSKKFIDYGVSISFDAVGIGEAVGPAVYRWTGTPNAPFLDPIADWETMYLDDGWYMDSEHITWSPIDSVWQTYIPDHTTIVQGNNNIAIMIFGKQISELFVTHVQIYLGDTDIPFCPTPYFDELSNCMRYYEETKYPPIDGYFPYQTLKGHLPDVETDDPEIIIEQVYSHGFVVKNTSKEFVARISAEIGG